MDRELSTVLEHISRHEVEEGTARELQLRVVAPFTLS